jgi:geranylgeranyl pyrophosphate synthase
MDDRPLTLARRRRDRTASRVVRRLDATLLRPAGDFVARPSHGWRSGLVAIGWQLVAGDRRPPPALLPQLVELVHAGSLVIDDIEDGSCERRGAPALHRRIGLPLALNVGNWLYFAPLALLPSLGCAPALELALHRRMTDAMARCHCGQALDLGVRVDRVAQDEIADVARVIATLKTGALTELAIASGAIAAGATAPALDRIARFGRRFGVALQMLNDVRSLRAVGPAARRHEDVRLARATWVWAWLAGRLDAGAYARLRREAGRVARGRRPADALARRLHGLVGDHGRRVATRALAAAVRSLARDHAGSPALAAVRRTTAALLAAAAPAATAPPRMRSGARSARRAVHG